MGYCVASVNGSSAHLISIAVSPIRRRVGIGIDLMESLIADLSSRGIHEVWLEAKLDNSEAIGMYRKLGFNEVSVVSEYYSDGSNALRMRKVLA